MEIAPVKDIGHDPPVPHEQHMRYWWLLDLNSADRELKPQEKNTSALEIKK